MLWWFFLAALILPYLIALAPDSVNPLIGFDVSEDLLAQWIQEIDSSAHVLGGGGSGSSTDSVESDWEYLVTADTVTSDDLFLHLQNKVQDKLTREMWAITESGCSNESFSFVFSHGVSRYRLYVWNVPLTKEDCRYAETVGKNVVRIKILKIGYLSRYGNLQTR